MLLFDNGGVRVCVIALFALQLVMQHLHMYQYGPRRECKNQLIVGANGGRTNLEGLNCPSCGMVECRLTWGFIWISVVWLGSWGCRFLPWMWTRWGHGEHCMPPVRPGGKPQPKPILVNFRTIMKLYIWSWCNLICHMIYADEFHQI